MWLLKKLTNPVALQYMISEKKCYTVGRKNSDLTLDDTSISRSHCVINIAPKKDCPFTVQTHTGVWMIDKKSKYGTYVHKNHEWVRLDEEQIEELTNGLIIRFGLMQNIWRIEYQPVMVCTSRLSNEQTQELKSQLAAVDGRLLSKWTKQCTFVIVNNITLTIKVLLALINGVPVVTTNYMKKVIENVRLNKPLPDCSEFKPQIIESTLVPHLVSLNPQENRKELFKGKTFVIPREEQLENLREIIEAAGGSVELLKLDGNWRKLSDGNTIVVQLPCNKIINPDPNAQAFKNLTNVLKNEYQVRVVPETEIYQAIAYSSVEKYCNPKSQAFELRQSSYNQNSCGDVIEEETPTQSHFREQLHQPTTSLIREPNQQDQSTNTKDVTPSRKRTHSPELENESKRPAIDIPVSNADGDDSDLFCKSSNDEQDKPIEETAKKEGISSNLKNLQITNDPVKEVKSSDNLCEKSSSKNFTLNFDYELGDFWDYEPQKIVEKESEKRKLSTESSERSEFAPVEKRKRLEPENTTSKKAVTVQEKSVQEPTPSSSLRHNSKNTPKTGGKPKQIILIDGGKETVWYLRKNADRSNREKEDSPEIVGSVSRFRKRVRDIPEPTVPYSRERVEEIGKMLMMQGWHMSRAARNRASGSSCT